MVSIPFNILHLASFGQVSQSDEIVLVEFGLVGGQDGAIGLEFVEPGGFFGEDHSVVGE